MILKSQTLFTNKIAQGKRSIILLLVSYDLLFSIDQQLTIVSPMMLDSITGSSRSRSKLPTYDIGTKY